MSCEWQWASFFFSCSADQLWPSHIAQGQKLSTKALTKRNGANSHLFLFRFPNCLIIQILHYPLPDGCCSED
jgi:hypothetical protein